MEFLLKTERGSDSPCCSYRCSFWTALFVCRLPLAGLTLHFVVFFPVSVCLSCSITFSLLHSACLSCRPILHGLMFFLDIAQVESLTHCVYYIRWEALSFCYYYFIQKTFPYDKVIHVDIVCVCQPQPADLSDGSSAEFTATPHRNTCSMQVSPFHL